MPRPLTSWVWEHCVRSEDGAQATCKLCNDVLSVKGSTSALNKHLKIIHGLMSDTSNNYDLPRKRRHIDPSLCDDDETDDESDETIQSCTQDPATSAPSTSRGSAEMLTRGRTANVCAIDNQEKSTPLKSSSTTANNRKRVRSVANGIQTERPCNRDRTEMIIQALTKMIIVNMLPISFAASDGYREYMELLEPNFKIPCIKTVKNRIKFIHGQVAIKIAAELSEVQSVAWTSDCWSSRNQDSYMSVTAHFLDSKWIPKSYALSTEKMSERHTAANLTTKLQDVMEGWKLVGKVVTVVTDNAQNAKNSVRNLDGIDFKEGVTCAAHSLQLCVTKALKNNCATEVCEKASKIVAHFNHSNIASNALEEKQEQLGLPKLKLIQSCCTRWDSTYAMVDRLLINRSVVTTVLSDRSVTNPATAKRLEISEQDWTTMENLQKILKPLQVATTVFCKDSHSPMSLVRPVVFSLRKNHLCESHDDGTVIASMKRTLRDEMTSRFELEYDSEIGVNARQVASFLDPRYKDLLEECPDARDDVRSFVRNSLTSDTIAKDDSVNQQTAMDFLFQSSPQRSTAETQFQTYLSEPQIGYNMNPFEWWEAREKRYPDLAKLAKKYLCVPATSASSERVFSSAGNIVSAKRSCLLPENVDMLVFLYQNRHLVKSKK